MFVHPHKSKTSSDSPIIGDKLTAVAHGEIILRAVRLSMKSLVQSSPSWAVAVRGSLAAVALIDHLAGILDWYIPCTQILRGKPVGPQIERVSGAPTRPCTKG